MQRRVSDLASDSSSEASEALTSEDEVHYAGLDEDEFACDTKMEADLSAWVNQLGGNSAADALSIALSRVKADDSSTPPALADGSLTRPEVTMLGVLECSISMDVLQAQLHLTCAISQDEKAHLFSGVLSAPVPRGYRDGDVVRLGNSRRLTPRAEAVPRPPSHSVALTQGFGKECLLRSYATTDRVGTLVISFAGNVQGGGAAGRHDFVGVCKRVDASALFIRGNPLSPRTT